MAFYVPISAAQAVCLQIQVKSIFVNTYFLIELLIPVIMEFYAFTTGYSCKSCITVLLPQMGFLSFLLAMWFEFHKLVVEINMSVLAFSVQCGRTILLKHSGLLQAYLSIIPVWKISIQSCKTLPNFTFADMIVCCLRKQYKIREQVTQHDFPQEIS